MKKILFLTTAVLLTIYFAGCKENSVTYNSKQNGTVSGKIQNWNLGSNKKLIAIIHGGDTLSISLVFDSCAIDNTGNFAMNLDTPPDSLLMLYKLNDTLCTHHTVIEPVDLNYCTVDFLVKDSVNSTVGFIYSSNSTLPNIFSGKINSYWYYFNIICRCQFRKINSY